MFGRRVGILPDDQHAHVIKRKGEGAQHVWPGGQILASGGDLVPQKLAQLGDLIGHSPDIIGIDKGIGLGLLALCLLFFLWQVPHFWMLMLLHDQDYRRAQFPTLSRHFRPDQSARLTFTWMAATAFSCAFLPAFGAVFSLPVLAALALAALWLVWRAAALLQGPLDGRTLRATFWSINLFALVLILAVSADPFLPAPAVRAPAMARLVP